MGYKFNPFTGNLDTTDSPNGVFEEIEVNGDITLDDGGTYTTTLQTITPTVSNKTISLPDATGTVALVAGSSGQLVYNNAGAQAGAPGSVVGATGNITLSLNGAASVPPFAVTGTWFAGTTPQVLIQPSNVGTTGAWSASGTGIGVNAASGFTGRLLDLQTNGTSRAVVTGAGNVGIGTTSPSANMDIIGATSGAANNTITGASLRVQSTTAGGENFAIRHRNSTVGISGLQSSCQLIGLGTNAIELYTVEATPLVFGTSAVERLRLDSIGSVRVVTALTVATLPGTPAVGMVARVTDALAPAVGVTVVGGGAAAALCWYNGANWSVIGV